MRLWINREGAQLGPFTVEEARAQVLTGQLTALDWAWIDGGTEWIPLKDVPNFSTYSAPPLSAPSPPPPVSISTPTPAAAPIAPKIETATSGEEILWRGHPSQILLLRIYLFWAIVFAGLLIATMARHDLWPIPAVLALFALLQLTWRNLRLRSFEYIITTQRVRVISGLLGKSTQEIELFRVKDTMVYQWFIQRLFGLGTITIISGDAQSPRLVLRGVPRASALRERLRTEVIALRQRYNVREMDVM